MLTKPQDFLILNRTHWDSADEIRIEAKQDKNQDPV